MIYKKSFYDRWNAKSQKYKQYLLIINKKLEFSLMNLGTDINIKKIKVSQ